MRDSKGNTAPAEAMAKAITEALRPATDAARLVGALDRMPRVDLAGDGIWLELPSLETLDATTTILRTIGDAEGLPERLILVDYDWFDDMNADMPAAGDDGMVPVEAFLSVMRNYATDMVAAIAAEG